MDGSSAVEVRPCPHGRGLFASEEIARGRVIRQFDDVALSSHPKPGPEGDYALRMGEHLYWDGFPPGSPDYWSNFIDHRDEPNAAFVFNLEKKMAWLKAVKTILKGDEIFINYSHYDSANPTF